MCSIARFTRAHRNWLSTSRAIWRSLEKAMNPLRKLIACMKYCVARNEVGANGMIKPQRNIYTHMPGLSRGQMSTRNNGYD